MSASVFCSVSVQNKSSSDGSDALGTNFCKGGAARKLQCIATVAYLGGFSLLYQRNAINRHFMYKLHYLCLCLSLTLQLKMT